MKVTRNLRLLAFVTLLCAWKITIATIDFQNLSSRLVFDNNTALLLIKNQQKILGWSKLSMVKENGNVPATNWVEGYGNNVIIGPSGATKVPQTNLVIANSNTINYLAPNVLPTPVPTADSINGTLLVQYKTKHHVFHNNSNTWTARGFVRFNDGFTIMPRASVIMDIVTSVSGGMDLRDTGTLILAGDLYLAHNVTLTNGGNIKGRTGFNGPANTIFMGGDLTVAATTYARTLHITGDWSSSGTSGDLIIDGCGHTLNIGDRAQIFVDTNVTLTLRNMTIRTGPKSLNNPSIQLASLGSKLVLDNVMFDLGADFHFITGQIFVHNEVAMTGTSAFVYQSPRPSYITSGATWSFEQGTTFSVAPSTFTDSPFTVNNTYTNNAFLVLPDASSALSLNGCSFQTTYTGLRLRTGMVLLDNKVAIDTTAGVDLNNTTPLTEIGSGVTTGNVTEAVAWSPDSKFLAVVNFSSNTMQVYRFDGINVPTTVGTTVSTATGPRSVSWSSDGRFLAVAIYSSPYGVQVYRFDGSTKPSPVGNLVTTGTLAKAVAWSPDGKFLALTYMGSPYGVQIYRFNGVSSPVPVGGKGTSSGNPYAVAWSPDGRFLAVPNQTDGTFQVYRFNGNSTPTMVGGVVASGFSSVYDARWSPDGRFLLVSGTGLGLKMYRFNGVSTPMPVGNSFGPTATMWSVSWSPDGRFFIAVNNSFENIQMYRFDGITPSPVGSAIPVASQTSLTSWSPDGNFIAVVNKSSPGALHIFRCNYYYTGQPSATQGFTNGLLFGDKAKGSSFNANVQILDGATVTVKGMVSDDAA